MTQPNQSELIESVLSILGIVDRTSGNRPEQIATLEQELTAHTNAEIAKALIKELENVDKLTRPTLPDSGSVEMNVRAWCMDRIAILAKIKEV